MIDTQAYVEQFGLAACIQCGKCTGGCPVSPKSALNPRALVYQMLRGEDFELVAREELWDCTTCSTCGLRCPKGVKAVDLIIGLRGQWIESGKIPTTLRAPLTATLGIEMRDLLRLRVPSELSAEYLNGLGRQVMARMALAAAPVMGAAFVISIVSNLIQGGGFRLSAHSLGFHFDKLSPASGLSRVFSKNGAVQLVKSVFLLTVVSVISYQVISQHLALFPRMVLMDEISLGLMPIYVEETFRVIGNLRKQGVTILLVEQNARKALAAAHRGYVLETGEIVLSDTSAQLANNPQVKKAYLGGS